MENKRYYKNTKKYKKNKKKYKKNKKEFTKKNKKEFTKKNKKEFTKKNKKGGVSLKELASAALVKNNIRPDELRRLEYPEDIVVPVENSWRTARTRAVNDIRSYSKDKPVTNRKFLKFLYNTMKYSDEEKDILDIYVPQILNNNSHDMTVPLQHEGWEEIIHWNRPINESTMRQMQNDLHIRLQPRNYDDAEPTGDELDAWVEEQYEQYYM